MYQTKLFLPSLPHFWENKVALQVLKFSIFSIKLIVNVHVIYYRNCHEIPFNLLKKGLKLIEK